MSNGELFYSTLDLTQEALLNSVLTKDEIDTRPPKADIGYFWVLLKKLIEFKLGSEKLADVEIYGSFSNKNNPMEFPLEIITHENIKRSPASTDRTAKAFRPFIMADNLPDEDNPDYKLKLYGQTIENQVRVTVWAKTGTEADDRALWLENIFLDYVWFFNYMGIDKVIWQGQAEDVEKYPTEGGQTYYGRPIHLNVVTTKTWTRREKTLENVHIYQRRA